MELRDKYRVAVLAAYALALHGFESLLPSPIPWLRLGLTNIITVVALVLYGFRTAILVTLMRIILASLFTGTFLGPAFMLSLGGGLASTMAMGLTLWLFRGLFGTVGISLVGALFHNLGQLSLAYLLFIQRIEAVLLVAPVILFAGTLTGLVNGVIADILVKNLLQKETKTVQNG